MKTNNKPKLIIIECDARGRSTQKRRNNQRQEINETKGR